MTLDLSSRLDDFARRLEVLEHELAELRQLARPQAPSVPPPPVVASTAGHRFSLPAATAAAPPPATASRGSPPARLGKSTGRCSSARRRSPGPAAP